MKKMKDKQNQNEQNQLVIREPVEDASIPEPAFPMDIVIDIQLGKPGGGKGIHTEK